MWSRWIALALGALLASQGANAACVIHGGRPTVPLPTMVIGQEFSFIASSDCETLRFTIRGIRGWSKIPTSGGRLGPGPHTYKVVLTESEWDSVSRDGLTVTWVVTGRTSAGVMTRMVTTNHLKRDETTPIDLSMADAKIVAEASIEPDYAGYSVSGAGDVDGDGHDDLLIGAYENEEGGAHAGAAYLVRGPVTGTVDLSLADAKLVGEEAYDHAGLSLAGAGDVDGDGHDDLLIGGDLDVHNEGDQHGAAYLVRGPVSGTLSLSLADAKLIGENTDDLAGGSVSGAGDVDGDGHDDLLVGAPDHRNPRAPYGGAAYLVLGPATGIVDLSVADAKFVGDRPYDAAGNSVAGAGDVDGDGRNDLLIGVSASGTGGAAYLVLGPVTGTLDPSMANAGLRGDEGDDNGLGVGFSVSGAGDVDADGHDDLLIGSPDDDEGGSGAGAAYLVLGPLTGTNSMARADAKLVGEGRDYPDYAGWSVAGAGDVDSDGHDDFLVGASHDDSGGDSAGAAYLVRGPVTGTVELTHADAVFTGEEDHDFAGVSVSGAGDVDADGQDDLLVGTLGARAAYLIYGGGL